MTGMKKILRMSEMNLNDDNSTQFANGSNQYKLPLPNILMTAIGAGDHTRLQ